MVDQILFFFFLKKLIFQLFFPIIFMTFLLVILQSCLVKVNTRSSWQKTVAKVLNKCHGMLFHVWSDENLVVTSLHLFLCLEMDTKWYGSLLKSRRYSKDFNIK